VECHVAPSIALEHLYAALSELFGRGNDVGRFRVASQGDDGRVLEQEENVADLALFAEIDEPLLQTQGGGVVDRVEMEDRDHW